MKADGDSGALGGPNFFLPVDPALPTPMVVVFTEGQVAVASPVKAAASHHLVLVAVIGPRLGPKLLVVDVHHRPTPLSRRQWS